jgi:hypothetical protein
VPVKQRILKERKPQFSPEVLRVFSELEQTPMRQRRSKWFQDTEKYLMCTLLDCGAEFWHMQSPLDRRSKTYYSPHECAYHSWHVCRRLRNDLLIASGLAKESRAGKAVVDLRNGAGQS